MQASGFPAAYYGCNTFVSVASGLSKEEQHVCTRHCAYSHVMGNMWSCQTSGSLHVCDQNCTQRIYYDSYRTICRLSKRLFANTEAPLSEGPRKRPSESGYGGEPEARELEAKKSLTQADWAAQQALVDAASANTAWAASEVASWARVAH